MIDDKIEITHIPDEGEKPKWEGKPFVYMPQLSPTYYEGLTTLDYDKVITAMGKKVKKVSVPNEMVEEVFKLLEKSEEVHEKMLPYTIMASIGAINHETWQELYENFYKNL